jgi:RimJ/RimL family protein N-acetyltransferase
MIELEMETLWGLDARGRVMASHHLVAGVTPDEVAVRYGAGEPDELVERLAAIVPDPADIKPYLAQCQRLLDERYGGTVVNSGPGYLIPDGIAYDTDAELVDPTTPRRELDRPETWEPNEWQELLAGTLGPWAIALRDGRVAAVAHTPASTERAAEIGIWTHPDFRGQGLAAATTAHWARVASGRTLFYSTSADNLSSKRVAARLGLEQLGWLWKISNPAGADQHAGRR